MELENTIGFKAKITKITPIQMMIIVIGMMMIRQLVATIGQTTLASPG